MAYARQPEVQAEGEGAGPAAGGAPAEPEQPKPGETGPAQSSGRLWVPGQ